MQCHKLIKLEFRKEFNQPINNFLAPNLQHIRLGDNFDQPVNNFKVPYLQNITFGKKFNKDIKEFMKNNTQLKSLDIINCYYEYELDDDDIPNNLRI